MPFALSMYTYICVHYMYTSYTHRHNVHKNIYISYIVVQFLSPSFSEPASPLQSPLPRGWRWPAGSACGSRRSWWSWTPYWPGAGGFSYPAWMMRWHHLSQTHSPAAGHRNRLQDRTQHRTTPSECVSSRSEYTCSHV